MKYLVSKLTIFAFFLFSTVASHTDLTSFLKLRKKKNEDNPLKSFVDVIGGTEKVDEIKKIFGFDVVKALKALLNYERKTMVQSKI